MDVTLPTTNGRGLRIHRSPLPTTATVLLDGIRVTTAARTLTDLRRVAEPGIYRPRPAPG